MVNSGRSPYDRITSMFNVGNEGVAILRREGCKKVFGH